VTPVTAVIPFQVFNLTRTFRRFKSHILDERRLPLRFGNQQQTITPPRRRCPSKRNLFLLLTTLFFVLITAKSANSQRVYLYAVPPEDQFGTAQSSRAVYAVSTLVLQWRRT
jgi:hypothetical protein